MGIEAKQSSFRKTEITAKFTKVPDLLKFILLCLICNFLEIENKYKNKRNVNFYIYFQNCFALFRISHKHGRGLREPYYQLTSPLYKHLKLQNMADDMLRSCSLCVTNTQHRSNNQVSCND